MARSAAAVIHKLTLENQTVRILKSDRTSRKLRRTLHKFTRLNSNVSRVPNANGTIEITGTRILKPTGIDQKN
jgi:hypothetical protein